MNTDLSFPHPVLGNLKDFTVNKFSINVRKRLFDGKFEFITSFDIGSLQDDYEELDKEDGIIKRDEKIVRYYLINEGCELLEVEKIG